MINSKEVPTVLIVDDEPDLLEVLSDDVTLMGYKVMTANNGLEAVTTLTEMSLKEIYISAILSDINMPQLNGFQLLERVHQMNMDIPTIFISGYGDKEKAIKAMKLGAVDFLEKPYNRNLLENALKKATDLGMSLKDLEQEIEDYIAKFPEHDPEAAKARNSIRELLKIKKLRKIYSSAS